MLLREWGAISLFLGLISTIFFVASFSDQNRVKILPTQARALIEIKLTGAVKKPGIYHCEPGVTLKKLLGEVSLSKKADRKRIPFKKVLFSAQSIDIPEKNQKKGFPSGNIDEFSLEKKFSLEKN